MTSTPALLTNVARILWRSRLFINRRSAQIKFFPFQNHIHAKVIVRLISSRLSNGLELQLQLRAWVHARGHTSFFDLYPEAVFHGSPILLTSRGGMVTISPSPENLQRCPHNMQNFSSIVWDLKILHIWSRNAHRRRQIVLNVRNIFTSPNHIGLCFALVDEEQEHQWKMRPSQTADSMIFVDHSSNPAPSERIINIRLRCRFGLLSPARRRHYLCARLCNYASMTAQSARGSGSVARSHAQLTPPPPSQLLANSAAIYPLDIGCGYPSQNPAASVYRGCCSSGVISRNR